MGMKYNNSLPQMAPVTGLEPAFSDSTDRRDVPFVFTGDMTMAGLASATVP